MNAGAEHVRVHGAEPGSLADRPDPAVGGAAVEALAVPAAQDRALVAFADGEVDRASGTGNERDDGGLVAFADDPQGAVAALEAEVLDVGRARLADSEAVEAEQHGEGGVGAVEAFGGEQERAELGAVHAAAVAGLDLRAADVLGGVRRDPAVDVREPVEPAHGRQATVDRRRRQPSLLHRASVQLDVRPGGGEHPEPVVGAHWKNMRRSWRYASRVRPL